jgi:tetratricopeptide (TPR) repeat protein
LSFLPIYYLIWVKIKLLKYLILPPLLFIFFVACTNRSVKIEKHNLFYNQALVYRDKGVVDSAFLYFNEAKDLFLQQKDSLGAGKCLVNMAIISTDKGDYYGAQEISLDAMRYFDLESEASYIYIRSNYNNLGLATHNLGDYKGAISFFNKAITNARDSVDARVIINNKARTYQVIKEYGTALKLYNLALDGASKNKIEYARALSNISYTKLLQDSTYNVVPQYLKALRIRQEGHDLWGQNSSYSYLSDYYAKKNTDSALFYANKMYTVAKQLNSAYDKMEALQQLVKFSPAEVSKKYFETFQYLNDSVQDARQNAKNQFALIRYETEKHKTDFLKAQADNIKKRNNIIAQNFILGILGVGILSVFFWYRKHKKILQQERELEVKNTELKYVKKIHDRVANKVYQVMSEVENNLDVDRGILLDKLEDLYNVSRDISYENDEVDSFHNYSEQLSSMLQSYSSESKEVLIVGNEEEVWEFVNGAAKAELLVIMQELMTNMKKHSEASSVVIKVQCSLDFITILYADNGIGIKGSTKKNGLKNTENRMKSIRGTIKFDSQPEEGLVIHLSFPIL